MSPISLRTRLLSILAAAFLLLGIAPLLSAAPAGATDGEAAAADTTCTQAITTADFIRDRATGMAEIDGVWGEVASTRIRLRDSFAVQPGCSFSFSLASYETEGPTWPLSGKQTFLDHDVIALDATTRSGVLTVDAPTCYGQVDLYHGSLIYDGGEGEGHAPVPDYPDRQIVGLIAGFDGGTACAIPVSDVVINPCVDGQSSATVTLSVGAGFGTSAFTVWSKVGDADFTQVGGTTTLPAGTVREAAVTVPLVEDVPVIIEVRVGDEVLETYDAITADCEPTPPSTPSAEVEVNACVHKSATATVTLAVSEGTGATAFTVWSQVGDADFTQVGGTTTLPAGTVRQATVTVPLVEDVPVTIEVRAGDEVIETFEPITANCKPDPVTPATDITINPCVHGKYATATVELSVSEGYGYSALTLWAKVGNGSYSRVGGTTYLPAWGDRDAKVTLPLVEDTAVTIQVRDGSSVVETFGPIVANCKDKPAKPSVDLKVNPCVHKSATATVKLSLSEGSGSSAFTVWAKTGNGSYAKVGGTTVLPAENVRQAAVNVPLVEDKPVTIQVRVGNEVVKTFSPVTANCKGSSHDYPCKDKVEVVKHVVKEICDDPHALLKKLFGFFR